jgi:hypothetical protein
MKIFTKIKYVLPIFTSSFEHTMDSSLESNHFSLLQSSGGESTVAHSPLLLLSFELTEPPIPESFLVSSEPESVERVSELEPLKLEEDVASLDDDRGLRGCGTTGGSTFKVLSFVF